MERRETNMSTRHFLRAYLFLGDVPCGRFSVARVALWRVTLAAADAHAWPDGAARGRVAAQAPDVRGSLELRGEFLSTGGDSAAQTTRTQTSLG